MFKIPKYVSGISDVRVFTSMIADVTYHNYKKIDIYALKNSVVNATMVVIIKATYLKNTGTNAVIGKVIREQKLIIRNLILSEISTGILAASQMIIIKCISTFIYTKLTFS